VDRFEADIHDALHMKIYPFPKLERDADGVPLPPSRAKPPSVENVGGGGPNSCNTERDAHAALRTGWLEFFRQRGYMDRTNHIIWEENPAAILNTFSYMRLLVITDATNPLAPFRFVAGHVPTSGWQAASNPPLVQAAIGHGLQAALQQAIVDWAVATTLLRSNSNAFTTAAAHSLRDKVAIGSQPLHTKETTTAWRTWRMVPPSIALVSTLAPPSVVAEHGTIAAHRTSSPTSSGGATPTHSVTLPVQVSTLLLRKPPRHHFVSYPVPKILEVVRIQRQLLVECT
jgi:hypothetical protein